MLASPPWKNILSTASKFQQIFLESTGDEPGFRNPLSKAKPMTNLLRPPIVWSACIIAALSCCTGCGQDGQKHGNYTVYGPYYDDTKMDRAINNAQDQLIKRSGEANLCMVGLWAYNPPAILSAVKTQKKEGLVKIVGFDEDDVTLQGIQEGQVHATVVQDPFEFGYQSIKLLKEMSENPNAKIEPIRYIPHRVINKANVEAFRRELQAKRDSVKQETPKFPEGTPRFAFVSNNPHEFWTLAEAGCRKASQDLGVEVIFRKPDRGDVKLQNDIVQDLVGKVKGVAISVIDPINQEDFLNKVADQIPLIAVDNDAPKTRRRCYVGTNNIEAGMAVGKLVREVLPSGGSVVIFVGQPDPLNAQERKQGVLNALDAK